MNIKLTHLNKSKYYPIKHVREDGNMKLMKIGGRSA